MRLNVGCGRNAIDGYVNVDLAPLPGVDVVADCEAGLPFKDNSFDETVGSHIIEHITNTLNFMQELHRVAKPGATAVFRLPYGHSDDAWEDPTHKRPYYSNSFGYFSQPFYWRADYGYRGDWQLEKVTFIIGKKFAKETKQATLTMIHHSRNVVQEMIVELRCIKPIREPLRELQQATLLEIEVV